MAKEIGNYESIFIVDPVLGEDGINAVVEKFQSLVEANGTLKEITHWGKRRLAYQINDLPEGYYVLMTFSSEPSLPAELDRVYKITDGIMRSLIICTDD